MSLDELEDRLKEARAKKETAKARLERAWEIERNVDIYELAMRPELPRETDDAQAAYDLAAKTCREAWQAFKAAGGEV